MSIDVGLALNGLILPCIQHSHFQKVDLIIAFLDDGSDMLLSTAEVNLCKSQGMFPFYLA